MCAHVKQDATQFAGETCNNMVDYLVRRKSCRIFGLHDVTHNFGPAESRQNTQLLERAPTTAHKYRHSHAPLQHWQEQANTRTIPTVN